MNFDLTDEQRMLQDTLGRMLEKHGTAAWGALAELGFLSLPVESSPIETMLVMEALGRARCPEPFLSCAVLAGGLLARTASASQRAELLPAIASGRRLVVLAHAESHSRYDLHAVMARARATPEGFALDGTKVLVPLATTADEFLVAAQASDASGESLGITLFRVRGHSTGLRRRGYRLQDGQEAGDLHLKDVRVSVDDVIGTVGDGLAALQAVSDQAIAALAAEAVGAMQALLDLTVEHLRQRKQFGQPIGGFQALQHRAAEMLVETEQARSMAIYAALMVDEPDDTRRRHALSQVKAQVGASGRFVGEAGVQLHGGLGVSEEHAAGRTLKRLVAIDTLFGDRAFHLARLAATGETNDTDTLLYGPIDRLD